MKRPYVIIGVLFLLFTAPGITAYLFYTHPVWLKTTTNHGKLLPQPNMLAVLEPSAKWQLLYWHPGFCDKLCSKRMNDLARIRLALGRKVRQIDIALLLSKNDAIVSDELRTQLTTEDSQIGIVDAESDRILLGHNPAIYIANPQHSLILAYDENQSLDDIFQDLKHLVADK